MIFLMRLGVVQPAVFRKFRRHAIVANVALAMFLTPPDVISQIMLTVPVMFLYEVSIWCVVLMERDAARQEEEAAAE